MEFKHDESWDAMTSIIESQITVKDAWSRFIDVHEQIVAKPYWLRLRNMNIEAEQSEIVEWLQHLFTSDPIPEAVVALWIGIFRTADTEIPTIYLSGADNYSAEDSEWACDPIYIPQERYAQPKVLRDMDDIFRTDQENYEFLDWIFPLAYCAFTFDEVFRIKIDKRLLFKNRPEIPITMGHDGGDYIQLSAVE